MNKVTCVDADVFFGVTRGKWMWTTVNVDTLALDQ
jgi:hypothetical protein